MKTMQDKYVQFLIDAGEIEIPFKSRKYRVFTNKTGGFYYLGKSGAFRVGKSIADSVPCRVMAKKIITDG